jgi:hypothetical protein
VEGEDPTASSLVASRMYSVCLFQLIKKDMRERLQFILTSSPFSTSVCESRTARENEQGVSDENQHHGQMRTSCQYALHLFSVIHPIGNTKTQPETVVTNEKVQGQLKCSMHRVIY